MIFGRKMKLFSYHFILKIFIKLQYCSTTKSLYIEPIVVNIHFGYRPLCTQLYKY